jgi:glycosyltransferase involved in cell wall biosynthesis
LLLVPDARDPVGFRPPTRPLRIAQVAPLYESVPPRLYGGTERVVAYLTDALASLGHDVTLFASGDSVSKAPLIAGRAHALRLDPSPLKSDLASHLAMLHAVRDRAAEFDVLHFHTDLVHLPIFEAMAGRTVTTLHGRVDIPDLTDVYRRWPKYPLVSISNDQRNPMPWANWIATVPHGLPSNFARVDDVPVGDHLVFVGRIAPEKRPDRAIEIARRAGRRLKIAAKVDAGDVRYFNEVIEPLLSEPHVEFLGELAEPEKRRLLASAAALIFPIDWPEPFGLVMIEAMACGTPVIAWRCGSVPEVVEEGVTGFVVDNEEAAAAACARLERIDRTRVVEAFAARFSALGMARRYLDVYARLGLQAHPERSAMRIPG